MTDDEYLRNRLNMINQNSHYGIMIDTEITDIVRSHIKRLEEMKMKATSVQSIENVKEMHLTIEKSGVGEITKVIVGVSTNDDIFEFHFSGDGCVVFADQWFNAVAEKAYKVDFESERNKRKMMETENYLLRGKIKELEEELKISKDQTNRLDRENDMLRGEIKEKNRKINDLYHKLHEAGIEKRRLEGELGRWKKEAADCLKLRDEAQKEAYKLKQENEKLTIEKVMLKEENEKLEKVSKEWEKEAVMFSDLRNKAKKELALEKAANEAQHKFIREYAGKGTEVQFNYAIDDAKEVSYVIVDKEKYNKNFEKWANTQSENTPTSTSRADILDQAKKCVCGQREQDYGTPESNFQLIADLWNDYLKKERLGRSKAVVDAVDVSMMMALMKIARIKNGGGSGDSFVDLAGYAACGGEIWHGQKVKDQN